MADIDTLIRGLRNFRTRSECIDRLVDLGHDVVAPLMAALSSHDESLVWSAIRALGLLEAKEAIPQLVEMLRDMRLAAPARDALCLITGEKHPAQYDRWKHLTVSAAPEKGAASERPLVELLHEALGDTKAIIEESAHGIVVIYALKGGRTQKVVVLETEDAGGIPLIAIYTECGRVQPDRYEWALRKNMVTPYGAYAIRDVDGHSMFVAVDTMFRAEASPVALAAAVRVLAKRGDSLEKHLTGKDNY